MSRVTGSIQDKYHITGSIQDKNHKGIYHAMVRIKAPDGKVTNRSKSTGIKVGRTKTEDKKARDQAIYIMHQWIEELEAECEAEEKAKNNMRLIQAIDEWLERKKTGRKKVRANTYQSYLSFSDNHIKPYFEQSNPYLTEIKYKDVSAFADHLAKTMQTPTIKKVLVILRGVLDDAVRADIIDYNPCDKLEFAKAQKYEAQTLTQEQAANLISAIEQDPDKVGIMLAIWLGLRRSEIAGLRWQDVDLVQDKVSIRNTKTRFSEVIEVEQTKSESSKRTLIIPLRLHNYLTMVQAKQNRDKELCGDAYIDSGHVCVWGDGKPQSPEYPYHALKRLEKELDLPSVRLHDLRHTAATLLVDGGMSLEKVRDYLGHDDISVTAGIYVHPAEAAQKEVADAMERIFSAG